MATITSPITGFKGTVVGVDFKDGTAETDDESALAYFSQAGYKVEGADDFKVESGPSRAGIELGTPYVGPDSGPDADAADPRNDAVPVGGVKSDGTIVAGDSKGKRVKPQPGAAVQETGVPDEHSAVPAAANPDSAASATPDGATKTVNPGKSDTGSTSASPGTPDGSAKGA